MYLFIYKRYHVSTVEPQENEVVNISEKGRDKFVFMIKGESKGIGLEVSWYCF